MQSIQIELTAFCVIIKKVAHLFIYEEVKQFDYVFDMESAEFFILIVPT